MRLFWNLLFEFAIWRAARNALLSEDRMSRAREWKRRANEYHHKAAAAE